MGCGCSNSATPVTPMVYDDESIPDEQATSYQENKAGKTLLKSHRFRNSVNPLLHQASINPHSSAAKTKKSLTGTGSTEVNSRLIADVENEPMYLSIPIYGYESYPLVSLEEACKPLLQLIKDLNSYVNIAKQNSKKPRDNLTSDESASIYLYSLEWPDALHRKLNHHLRQENREVLVPWFFYLKLFLTALFKLPNFDGDIIWRANKIKFEDYKTGAYHIWWAFSSCSSNLQVLESKMSLDTHSKPTIFSIKAFNGKNIRNHSYFDNEDEILLIPGSYFKVLHEGNPSSNLHIVKLEQVQPPHALLELPFQMVDDEDEGIETSRSMESKTHRLKSVNTTSQSSDTRSSFTQRQPITFTKISNNLNNCSAIPEGYAGLNWTNIDYMGEDYARRNKPDWLKLFHFYKTIGIINHHDNLPGVIERQNGLEFTVNTIEVTTVDEQIGELVINGFVKGEKVFTGAVELDSDQLFVIDLEWENIDMLEFDAAVKVALHSISLTYFDI